MLRERKRKNFIHMPLPSTSDENQTFPKKRIWKCSAGNERNLDREKKICVEEEDKLRNLQFENRK